MSTVDSIQTPRNRLLAAIPTAEWERVGRNFKPIFMPLGDVLYEPARPVNRIFFPTTSVLSVSCHMTDGRAGALTLIGREGFASVEAFLGGDSAPCRAVVLGEGWGYQIKRELLGRACEQGGSIVQVLCRWLLMFLDRRTSNELYLTQEHIAELIGVRRESVTEAARKLQIAGCIRYQRGHISVLDRTRLEARSCECYRIIKRDTDRLQAMSRSAKIAFTQSGVARTRSERSEFSSRHASSSFSSNLKGDTPCSTPLPSY